MSYQKVFKKQLLPALIAVATVPLFSQTTLAAESAITLEEIVVTARKRQESIQDVPVAVTAITPGQLERGSIKNVIDVAKLVPNVELHQTSQGSHSLSPSIRGLSYDDIEKSIELFANFKPETPFSPNWGKDRAESTLESCKG